jgi:Domain of unknown function (DUF4112)
MSRVTRLPRRGGHAGDALGEVETLAWLLDSSIPVPGTGGRRIGADAIVGLVPVVGDLLSAGVGLFVVWRGSRLGLPRVVVARMLANSAIDLAVGAIPVVGDAFDLWFKANTRNLRLMRHHLEEPGASTRREAVGLFILIGVVVLLFALVIWLLVALLTIEVG